MTVFGMTAFRRSHHAKPGDREPARESQKAVEWSRTVGALVDGRLNGLLVGDWFSGSLRSFT